VFQREKSDYLTHFIYIISARHPWLSPAILASSEAEMGRIVVPGQPRQIVQETPSPNNRK
jgi:hypothetical protein